MWLFLFMCTALSAWVLWLCLQSVPAHDSDALSHEPVHVLKKSQAKWIALTGFGVFAASFGLYVWQGHFLMKDQPFGARVSLWQAMAKTHPEQLTFAQMAVVMRAQQIRLANQPEFWSHLGEADMKAENFGDAAEDFSRLVTLTPGDSLAWTRLGMALIFSQNGKPSQVAKSAFEKAISLDPDNIGAAYFLARSEAVSGNLAHAQSLYENLMARLPKSDSRLELLSESMAQLKAQAANASGTQAMILGMVAKLEGELKSNPDNAEGWARLLRSYQVLGETPKYDRARAAMTRHFAGQTDVIAKIESQSQIAVTSEAKGP